MATATMVMPSSAKTEDQLVEATKPAAELKNWRKAIKAKRRPTSEPSQINDALEDLGRPVTAKEVSEKCGLSEQRCQEHFDFWTVTHKTTVKYKDKEEATILRMVKEGENLKYYFEFPAE